MSLIRRPEAIVAVVLIIAMIGVGLVDPAFWSLDNQFSLLRSNVIIGIMALGVLLVNLGTPDAPDARAPGSCRAQRRARRR